MKTKTFGLSHRGACDNSRMLIPLFGPMSINDLIRNLMKNNEDIKKACKQARLDYWKGRCNCDSNDFPTLFKESSYLHSEGEYSFETPGSAHTKIRYTEGKLHRFWMENQDRKYILDLEREGRLAIEEPNLAQEAPELYLKIFGERIENAIKENDEPYLKEMIKLEANRKLLIQLAIKQNNYKIIKFVFNLYKEDMEIMNCYLMEVTRGKSINIFQGMLTDFQSDVDLKQMMEVEANRKEVIQLVIENDDYRIFKLVISSYKEHDDILDHCLKEAVYERSINIFQGILADFRPDVNLKCRFGYSRDTMYDDNCKNNILYQLLSSMTNDERDIIMLQSLLNYPLMDINYLMYSQRDDYLKYAINFSQVNVLKTLLAHPRFNLPNSDLIFNYFITWIEYTHSDYEQRFKILMEDGRFDVNIVCPDERYYYRLLTPLLVAVRMHSEPDRIKEKNYKVELLLQSGANPNYQDSEGKTALSYSIGNLDVELDQLLLSYGVDPNCQDQKGKTALIHSFSVNNFWSMTDKIKLLVRYGANPKIIDSQGQNALDYWKKEKKRVFKDQKTKKTIKQITKILKNPSVWRITQQAPTYIKEENLTVKKGHIDGECAEKAFPLHFAVLKGDMKKVLFLISKGISVNEADSNGITPLMISVQNSNVVMMRMLLAHGASDNQTIKVGSTSLHIAAQTNQILILEELLSTGADVNKITGDGITPLHQSVHNGYLQAVKCLYHHGANTDVKDKWGNTSVTMAEKRRYYNHHSGTDIFFFLEKPPERSPWIRIPTKWQAREQVEEKTKQEAQTQKKEKKQEEEFHKKQEDEKQFQEDQCALIKLREALRQKEQQTGLRKIQKEKTRPRCK